jgi:hypothetical protein
MGVGGDGGGSTVGVPDQAYEFYRHLRVQPEYDTATLWSNMARCKILCRQDEGAIRVYEEVLSDHPNSLEASVGMAETLFSVGRPVKVPVVTVLACSGVYSPELCVGSDSPLALADSVVCMERSGWPT